MHIATLFSTLALLALGAAAPADDIPRPVARSVDGSSGPVTLQLRRDTSREFSHNLEEREQFFEDAVLHTKRRYYTHLDEFDRQRVDEELQKRAIRREEQLAKRQAGSLSSDAGALVGWARDMSYTLDIAIGTPPQNFEVMMDTGSSDTYVFGDTCTLPQCQNVPVFHPAQSSTFKPLNVPASNITFGIGYSYGQWGTDTVSVGKFQVTNQVFQRASQHDDGYVGTNTTGLMGLAWEVLTVEQETPWWINLMPSLQDQRFSFYLTRVNYQSYVNSPISYTSFPSWYGGEMTIGGVDTSKIQGQINYVPLLSKSYWLIPLDGFGINGKVYKAKATGAKNKAVIDTGSTLIMGPADAVNSFYSNIPGAKSSTNGDWVFPCKSASSIKAFFTFGGVDYPIYGNDLFRSPVTAQPSMCRGSIMTADFGGNTVDWIIGDVFLKNVVSVYQYNPPAVGFAKLADKFSPASGYLGSNVDGDTTTSNTGAADSWSGGGSGGSSGSDSNGSSNNGNTGKSGAVRNWNAGVVPVVLGAVGAVAASLL